MWILTLGTVVVFASLCAGETEDFTNSFVVEVDGGRRIVEDLAKRHGFYIEDEIEELNLYHLVHPEVNERSKRSADHHVSALNEHPVVKYTAQQRHLVREKRTRHIVYDKQRTFEYDEVANKSLYARVLPETDDRLDLKDEFGVVKMEMSFSDPYYKDQWYLNNRGQTEGLRGIDLNVQVAWRMGFTGKGVVTCILDDGVDHSHPDLVDNYDPDASADFNDKEDQNNDPMPRDTPYNSHGTRCAGEIAAKANNQNCGVGVAYDARIGGIRMLDGGVTDFLEAKALTYKPLYIHVFSASWGPKDDGRTLEAPYPLAVKAFQHGVLNGRNGLGSIYVWATGNGGLTMDDCNADGYVSRPETLSIGSVNDYGERPFFMEVCPSTLAVVPTGGFATPEESRMENKPKIKVVTTDLHKGCTLGFQGTSSAAPMAAGCIALALQANDQLTWRDVQHVVVHSAVIPINDGSWTLNGAGFHVSANFGFGMLDCSRMVMLAQEWTRVPPRHICEGELQKVNREIQNNGNITLIYKTDACAGDKDLEINSLEHVQIHVKLVHNFRGDVQILLQSPQGTQSEMLSRRPRDNSTDGIDFTFTSVQMWGEDPRGTWTLQVNDQSSDSERVNSGKLIEWTLILHGYMATSLHSVAQKRSFVPEKAQVDLIMNSEKERSLTVKIKKSDTLTPEQESEIEKLHIHTKQIPDDAFDSDKSKAIDEILEALRGKQKKVFQTNNIKRTLLNSLKKKAKKENCLDPSISDVLKENKDLWKNIRRRIHDLLEELREEDRS